jgi:hypothetical protein
MRGGKEQEGKAKLTATENKQPRTMIMAWTRVRIAYDLVGHQYNILLKRVAVLICRKAKLCK